MLGLDPVLVYMPEGAVPCEVIELGRRSFKVLHPDGVTQRYSCATGKPWGRRSNTMRCWVRRADARQLGELAITRGVGSGGRADVAAEITSLLLRSCPVAGAWLPVVESSVDLRQPVLAPKGHRPRARADVAYLELQRPRSGRQFRTLAGEVKSCRADFTSDANTLTVYPERFHGLFFACPEDVIRPDELPDEVGLYYYAPGFDGRGISFGPNGHLRTVRPPKLRTELPAATLVDTLRGMVLAAARTPEAAAE